MIVTDKIQLTTKELFKILIKRYLKKRWWLLVWIWVMIGLLLFRESNDSFRYFIVAALVGLQLIVVYQYWGYATSKDNAPSLKERYYEIDTDKVVGTTPDGKATTVENSLFIKVARTSKYYLLYTTAVEFIYLPFSSFKSSGDKEWFDREIIAKIKK